MFFKSPPSTFATCYLSIGVVLICFAGCDGSGASVDVEDQAGTRAIGTAQLEIDFESDRRNISVDIPCSDDSTVLSILQRAQNLGDLKFKSTGEDEFVFVSSIGGVDNQAAAGDNWVFQVNGKLGDRSCGVYRVKPGDHILWVFGSYP